MTKKIMAVLLSAVMLVTFMPAMAFASDGSVFVYKNVKYKVVSEKEKTATPIEVLSDFDGRFYSTVKRTLSLSYTVEEVDEPIVWNATVKTVEIPDTHFFCAPYAFKNATDVKKFKVWPETGTLFPNHAVDGNGILYETDYDAEEGTCTAYLTMVPPALTGITTLELINDCRDIYENAFDYSACAEDITKLIINNDGFYIDVMDYEDSDEGCLYERLAKKKDGSYNLTIRIPVPVDNNNITSFVSFAKWCQKNKKTGIKIEAPLESIGVKDVTYANRNKAKVYFGNLVLKAGEDYVVGDKNKVGKKLSNDNYYTLITGSNHFFLGSDTEPWEDYSVVSEYSVTPKKVTGLKVSHKTERINVKWKADKSSYGKSKHVSGYQISYTNTILNSTNTVNVKGYKKSNWKEDFENGKYTFKVRSYKKLSNGGYVYSPWSASKKVTIAID